ncbi:two component transcriptional regulator, winged helix family [Gloeothece citriformis PCC 7424]|uniref:Two component transcriptional regulator, winged helix family n=1 Tax=Gloeothece citriformis (strain PCC 7424) TaxID=65393 RepID=B7KFA9_GLOC7|nr:two component transcriptional regulator, winged helix family [Gloeothece citriformis PCC 7424]
MVVDDDAAVRNLISRFFGYNNYDTQTAPDARTARELFQRFQPDLVILDVNLPDESGFKLCQEIRKTGVLVLMLTCMTDTNYVLEGFEKGADDYLTKPFDLEILKAKVGALFKRRLADKPYHDSSFNNRIIFDKLVIDVEKCQVTVNNNLVLLTTLEYDLLYFLATHPNRVWDRSELLSSVWSDENEEDKAERKVDVHIGQIRKKIGDMDGKLIKTVRGKGYMFEPPVPISL